ncbi:hypothetical protein L6255_01640 [Candidatus Parcubacteria bacterium]|nr:hypothetical protein [Candidatus Parcubacteria bacterium]
MVLGGLGAIFAIGIAYKSWAMLPRRFGREKRKRGWIEEVVGEAMRLLGFASPLESLFSVNGYPVWEITYPPEQPGETILGNSGRVRLISTPVGLEVPGFLAATRADSKDPPFVAEALKSIGDFALPGSGSLWPRRLVRQILLTADMPSEQAPDVPLGRLLEPRAVRLKTEALLASSGATESTPRVEEVLTYGGTAVAKFGKAGTRKCAFVELRPRCLGFGKNLPLSEALNRLLSKGYPISFEAERIASGTVFGRLTAMVLLKNGRGSLKRALGEFRSAGFEIPLLGSSKTGASGLFRRFLPETEIEASGGFSLTAEEFCLVSDALCSSVGSASRDPDEALFVGLRGRTPCFLEPRPHELRTGVQGSGKTTGVNSSLLQRTGGRFVGIISGTDPKASTLAMVCDAGGKVVDVCGNDSEKTGRACVAEAIGFLQQGKPFTIRPIGVEFTPQLVQFAIGFVDEFTKEVPKADWSAVLPAGRHLGLLVDDLFRLLAARATYSMEAEVDRLLAILETAMSELWKPIPGGYPGCIVAVTTQAPGDPPQTMYDKFGIVIHHQGPKSAVISRYLDWEPTSINTWISNKDLHNLVSARR